MDVSAKELLLLKAINTSHRDGIPQPLHLRADVKDLIARGLVTESAAGLSVPDDVKFELLVTGQSLGR
jgi:hypothetical protein